MVYRLPEKEDEQMLKDYVREHDENGDLRISASVRLSSSDYDEWLKTVRQNADNGNEIWGRSLLYLCLDEDRLIGLLNIRYELPESYREKYGDIGYGVRPSERNKGYAGEMLRYGLSVCREKGMDQVILGCLKSNAASSAVIRKNGGILIAENDQYEKGTACQYYMIRL